MHVNRWSLGHSKATPSTSLNNQVIWGQGGKNKENGTDLKKMVTTASSTLKKYIKYSSNMGIENTVTGFGFRVDDSLV